MPATEASFRSSDASIRVNTGAASKVAPVVFTAAANQSPATAIGSAPAKF